MRHSAHPYILATSGLFKPEACLVSLLGGLQLYLATCVPKRLLYPVTDLAMSDFSLEFLCLIHVTDLSLGVWRRSCLLILYIAASTIQTSACLTWTLIVILYQSAWLLPNLACDLNTCLSHLSISKSKVAEPTTWHLRCPSPSNSCLYHQGYCARGHSCHLKLH